MNTALPCDPISKVHVVSAFQDLGYFPACLAVFRACSRCPRSFANASTLLISSTSDAIFFFFSFFSTLRLLRCYFFTHRFLPGAPEMLSRHHLLLLLDIPLSLGTCQEIYRYRNLPSKFEALIFLTNVERERERGRE